MDLSASLICFYLLNVFEKIHGFFVLCYRLSLRQRFWKKVYKAIYTTKYLLFMEQLAIAVNYIQAIYSLIKMFSLIVIHFYISFGDDNIIMYF